VRLTKKLEYLLADVRPYNQGKKSDRGHLASAIELFLISCGFHKENPVGYVEIVYSKPIEDTGVHVRVYTTIIHSSVRRLGPDGIRVAGLYNNKGVYKDIIKSSYIYRVGDICGIIDRIHYEIRKSWNICSNLERCTCGAPKLNTYVCANACCY